MHTSKLQDLIESTRVEKTEAMSKLERFRDFFQHLSDKGVPAPMPSTFDFLTDADLRKFTECRLSNEQ